MRRPFSTPHARIVTLGIGLIIAGAALYRLLAPDPYAFIVNTTPRSKPIFISDATRPTDILFTVLPTQKPTYYAVEIDLGSDAKLDSHDNAASTRLPVHVVLKRVMSNGETHVGPSGLRRQDCTTVDLLPSWAKEIPACKDIFFLNVSLDDGDKVRFRSAVFFLDEGQYNVTLKFLHDPPSSFGRHIRMAVRAVPYFPI